MDAKTRTAEARERYHQVLEGDAGTELIFAIFDFLAAAEDEALAQLGVSRPKLGVDGER